MRHNDLVVGARLLVALVTLALAAAACGGDTSGVLEVTDAWTRTTPPGASAAAFYMTVENRTEVDDTLLSGSSDRCEIIEIHRSQITDGLMEMRVATHDDLLVESGSTLVMEPTNLHVMCVGIVDPITDGDEVMLSLEFKNAGQVQVAVTVGEP